MERRHLRRPLSSDTRHHGRVEPLPSASRTPPRPPRPPAPPTTGSGRGLGDDGDGGAFRNRAAPARRVERPSARTFLAESARELAYVSWPRRAAIVNHSAVVVAVLTLCIALLVLVDAFGATALEWMVR